MGKEASRTHLCWHSEVLCFPTPHVFKEETEAEKRGASSLSHQSLMPITTTTVLATLKPGAHTKGGSLGHPHRSFRKTHLPKGKSNEKQLFG